MLEKVAGRVPLVIELKGSEGKDEGLVAAVAKTLATYRGEAAIMSFEHRFIRLFASEAPGIVCGLTAHGRTPADLEAHFSMLAHGIDFVSFHVADLPNRFVETVRNRLAMPVITWTVRDQWAVDVTRKHADQMTFESFEPGPGSGAGLATHQGTPP
jgi:glycerophosphoryl diester phosphodiesterase